MAKPSSSCACSFHISVTQTRVDGSWNKNILSTFTSVECFISWFNRNIHFILSSLCRLVAVESDFWCACPAALWGGKGLHWGCSGVCSSFLLPASFLYPMHYAFLSWTYNWPFSLMSANYVTLWAFATITDRWLLPVQAVSSAGLLTLIGRIRVPLSFSELT